MLFNNKLKTDYLERREFPSHECDDSFSFKYDSSYEEQNKIEIDRLIQLLSEQSGTINHFGLVLGLEKNPFIQYISICDCGHIHKYSIDMNSREYRRDEKKAIESLHLDICPNCEKPFTEDLTDYKVEVNKEENMGGIFLSGIDEETKTLYINIHQYMFLVKTEEFIIDLNVTENYILKNNEYDSEYLPYKLYANDFDEWWDCESDTTYFRPMYKDLYETMYQFNPDFKEFLLANECINKRYNDSFIDDEYSVSNNIHFFFRYYYIFCHFYKFYNKYDKRIQKSITEILLGLKKHSYGEEELFITDAIEELKPLEGNENIINNFLETFNGNEAVNINCISDIGGNISWMKEIIDSNLCEYLKHYIENEFFSLDDLLSLDYLREQYKEVSIESLLKYIIRGAINEEESITKISKQLIEMKEKSYDIEIKGAYQLKNYKKFNFIKTFEAEEQELFSKLENKSSFDSVYKELMAF